MTGYVPRWPFKFGKTYREECDVCLSDFLAAQNQLQQSEQQAQSMSRSLPSLCPVGTDDQVRDHLNNFRDRSQHSSVAGQCIVIVVFMSLPP